MSVVRIISDLHLGHTNLALHRGFASVEEHDQYIIDKWNSVVNKRDVTWILGDITMESKAPYPLLDQMNGMKKVVLGNHDKPKYIPELLKYVNCVGAMVRYKGGVVLTHCPVHESQLNRFKFNIHGHVHEASLPDPRYINVSAERLDYTPILISDLL